MQRAHRPHGFASVSSSSRSRNCMRQSSVARNSRMRACSSRRWPVTAATRSAGYSHGCVRAPPLPAVGLDRAFDLEHLERGEEARPPQVHGSLRARPASPSRSPPRSSMTSSTCSRDGNAVSMNQFWMRASSSPDEPDGVGAGRWPGRRGRSAGRARSPSRALGSARRTRGRACRSPCRARRSRRRT